MIFMVCASLALGFWQLGRAHQKQTLLTQQANSTQQQSVENEALLKLDPLAQKDHLFAPVKLQGQFDSAHTILLDNKTNHGQVGYHVLAPFWLSDNTLIYINRGWIPQKGPRKFKPKPEPVLGEVTIEGYLDFAYRNRFVSEVLESSETNDWPLRMQQIDLKMLSNLTGKTIFPMLVILKDTSPYSFVPAPAPTSWLNPQRHRAYAFQWFCLAAVIFALYCVNQYAQFRKRQKQ